MPDRIPDGFVVAKKTTFLSVAWSILNAEEGQLPIAMRLDLGDSHGPIFLPAGTPWERHRVPDDEYWVFQVRSGSRVRVSVYTNGENVCELLESGNRTCATEREPNMTTGVVRINIHEFNAYGAARTPLAQLLMEELSHYAVLDGHYLGLVFKHRGEEDYGFGLLGPDEKGRKCWIGGESTGLTRAEAESEVMQSLANEARLGKRVHPQE